MQILLVAAARQPRARGWIFFIFVLAATCYFFRCGPTEAIAGKIKIKIGRSFLEIQLTAIISSRTWGKWAESAPRLNERWNAAERCEVIIIFVLLDCVRGKAVVCRARMNHAPLLLRTPGSGFIIHRSGMQILVRLAIPVCALRFNARLRKENAFAGILFCYL